MEGRILLVDDDSQLGELAQAGLGRRGFEVEWRPSADQALLLLENTDFDVVVTDLNMNGMSGLALSERVVQNRPDTPVVVLTGHGSMETAIGAIRAGVYDFLTKPFELDALAFALQRAIQHKELREEVKRLRRQVEGAGGFGAMIGESPAMKRLQDLAARVATADASLLITGESGTGKELVARGLHKASHRASGPFVAINCAAMPETLLESELFGHVKGAFTDAKAARVGLFQQASGGTLFLDEIGEMPTGMQAKLLRALQERRVRPVGGTQEISFDSRVITATNRDLEQDVEEGRFREDLYYRINVVHLPVPPLRARGNDILLLAQHFIGVFAEKAGRRVQGLSSAAAEKLLNYDWPGNVRELENCIERAVALTRFEELTVDDLPEKVRRYQASAAAGGAPGAEGPLLSMEEVERRHVMHVLKSVGGNKSQAAQTLGFDRRTLYRKLERYGIELDAV